MTENLSKYEIDEDALSLKEAMDQILANLESAYQSYNVPLPTRRYWLIGDPAYDCEQATVSLMQMYLGMPGDEATTPQACSGPKTIVINISIVRKLNLKKDGSTPGPDVIQKDSEWAAVDMYVLMNSLSSFDAWTFNGGAPSAIATVTANSHEGGYESVQAQLTMIAP
jgi:hypothetical protein